jgi:hypothetical protein
MPNIAVEGTVEKLRFSVPRRLHCRAAPHLGRLTSSFCSADRLLPAPGCRPIMIGEREELADLRHSIADRS